MTRAGAEVSPALTEDALAAAMPHRPRRWYPGLVSTEADARSWARSGAPPGAIVAAAHQLAPRGRGGLLWDVDPDSGLAFSMVVRPETPATCEGWLWAVASCGAADALGPGTVLGWPDEVHADGELAAEVAVLAGGTSPTLDWAVLSVHVLDAGDDPATVVAEVSDAIERRQQQVGEEVLDELRARCATLGRRVRARMLPLGPGGTEVEGEAVDLNLDGALVLTTEKGRRVAVRPELLGVLDHLDVDGDDGDDGPDAPG